MKLAPQSSEVAESPLEVEPAAPLLALAPVQPPLELLSQSESQSSQDRFALRTASTSRKGIPRTAIRSQFRYFSTESSWARLLAASEVEVAQVEHSRRAAVEADTVVLPALEAEACHNGCTFAHHHDFAVGSSDR